MHLLLSGNWEESRFRGQNLKPGTVITSHEILASGTGLSASTIKRCLKNLESTGEIVCEGVRHLGTKITLVNFEKYQNNKEDGDPDNGHNIGQHNGQHNGLGDRLNDQSNKKERKKKKRTLPSARPGEDPSFNSAINMSAEQRLDSLSRWSRILNVWKSNEADYILKNAFEKYWMKYSEPLQEEIVQYVESLGPKSVHLSNLWLSTLMKNRLLHPGQIAIEIEKAEKFVKPEKKVPLNHRNNVGKF